MLKGKGEGGGVGLKFPYLPLPARVRAGGGGSSFRRGELFLFPELEILKIFLLNSLSFLSVCVCAPPCLCDKLDEIIFISRQRLHLLSVAGRLVFLSRKRNSSIFLLL